MTIALDHVDKHYGSRYALKAISLDIAPGEVVALIGPSGAGKSTLLRTLVGLEAITNGEIRCFEHRLTRGVPAPETLRALRQDVGFCFQDFQLFPHLTTLQNVTLPLVLTKKLGVAEARKRAEQVLSRVDMLEFSDRYPGALSGGQKQRVSLARALVLEPRAMLFDEPVSALDPECILDVVEEIAMLRAAGKAVLVTTHLLPFAKKIATRVVFMVDGALVEVGTPAEIFTAPKTERLVQYLAHSLA
ncbi:MAG: amino acid ABC transporter ATP-binding protein [Deltaproteobacteria bacterium]|nr:amino acid ABC transporter ATP-binding protein [Deltaproteobacteria bacterium]